MRKAAFPGMDKLGLLTLGIGGFAGLVSLGLLLVPSSSRALLLRLPRDRWSGRILTVVVVFWAFLLLYRMPLGRFDNLKPLVWPLAAVLTGGIWYWMDELLLPRAFGALLLLFPAPVLDAARVHPSGWSVVMSLVAYVCVVKGIALLLSPFWFRMGIQRFLATDIRCRVWGGAGAVASTILLVLAFVVY